jgi:thymidylate synthase (FAD)
MEITFTSEITVEEVQRMGSDRMIVEAMLVSTAGLNAEDAAQGSMEGRINYLMSRRHGTPFECGSLTVRVHAPIKVWREWHRHRVGWSYNEESGRYKDLDPVFYIPPRERLMIRPEDFKSSRPAFDKANDIEYECTVSCMKQGYSDAYQQYVKMLNMKVDRGLARDVLGVGIYSACYCTANPRSIMHFLELRTTDLTAKRPSAPLYEIEVAARKLEDIFALCWPITYAAWVKHGRSAP